MNRSRNIFFFFHPLEEEEEELMSNTDSDDDVEEMLNKSLKVHPSSFSPHLLDQFKSIVVRVVVSKLLQKGRKFGAVVRLNLTCIWALFELPQSSQAKF